MESEKIISAAEALEKLLAAERAKVQPLYLKLILEWLRGSLNPVFSPEQRFQRRDNAKDLMRACNLEDEVWQKLGIN